MGPVKGFRQTLDVRLELLKVFNPLGVLLHEHLLHHVNLLFQMFLLRVHLSLSATP